MKYQSTRPSSKSVNSYQAILEGLASDGGLYLPETFPVFDLKKLSLLDFKGIMIEILLGYFDEFGREKLKEIVDKAFDDKFDSLEITPCSKHGNLHILELYHGPTAAFKDVALSLLPHLMASAKQALQITKTLHILTATSGDTGSAALAAFSDIEGFTITVFYPSTDISEIQKRQMITNQGHNTTVVGVEGNFDDVQQALKTIFNQSDEFNLKLSSANSINIGRLIPQLSYYFKAYFDLVKDKTIQLGDEVSFSVPSGNFGNILAAYLAKLSGCPIKHLICASNENQVLTNFIHTGIYDRRRPFYQTTSPSMDILVSSNLERLLALMSHRDAKLIEGLMLKLEREGFYSIPKALYQEIQKIFLAEMVPQVKLTSTIKDFYAATECLLDPHSAIGVCAALDHTAIVPIIVCATASPFKFPTTVLRALNLPVLINDFDNLDQLKTLSGQTCPLHLSTLRNEPIRHPLTVKKDALKALVKSKEAYDND